MSNVREKIIAVVGVSNREEKFGFKIFGDLLGGGFNVHGVHPLGGEVLGKKIYKNLKEITPTPDLVITVVPPKVTENIVEECNALGIKEIWMQPGSESDAAVKKAEEYGLSVIHNACFMVQNGIW
jgi:uncharacterized protein